MSESRVAACIELILANNTNSAICTTATPRPLPDKATFPYITVQEVSNRELDTLSNPTGLSDGYIQFNCWSPDYEQASTCRQALKDLFDEYSGLAGSRLIDSSDQQLDTELYNGDLQLHQLITRYHIWWED